MEFDIFGNAIIDSRSLTRIKIDELWDRYCGLFGVCFSLDDFALAEEDMLNLISKSIEENQDYLSNFALSNNQNEDDFLETPDKTEEVSENGLISGKDGFSEKTTFEMKPFSEIKN